MVSLSSSGVSTLCGKNKTPRNQRGLCGVKILVLTEWRQVGPYVDASLTESVRILLFVFKPGALNCFAADAAYKQVWSKALAFPHHDHQAELVKGNV